MVFYFINHYQKINLVELCTKMAKWSYDRHLIDSCVNICNDTMDWVYRRCHSLINYEFLIEDADDAKDFVFKRTKKYIFLVRMPSVMQNKSQVINFRYPFFLY